MGISDDFRPQKKKEGRRFKIIGQADGRLGRSRKRKSDGQSRKGPAPIIITRGREGTANRGTFRGEVKWLSELRTYSGGNPGKKIRVQRVKGGVKRWGGEGGGGGGGHKTPRGRAGHQNLIGDMPKAGIVNLKRDKNVRTKDPGQNQLIKRTRATRIA